MSRRILVFTILFFSLAGVLILAIFSAPASAQFAIREPFTSSLNGWASTSGVVSWQASGTVGSYYQPDGDVGSAVWSGADSLKSPNIDIVDGTGTYTLHFDWYWTGESITVTHGGVIGTGLTCYGSSWPPPFDYFVVNKWNSCYVEFALYSGTASTRFDATSGALDMVQNFYLIPPAGDGGAAGQDLNGTVVPLTVTSALPTVTPLPPTATSSPSFYLQHAPPDGSLTTGVNERGVCTGLSYTGDSIGLYTYQDFGCDGIVYPAPIPPEQMIGNVWDFRYSTYEGTYGNPNLGVKTAIDKGRHQLDSPSGIVTIRMCTNSFVSSAPQTFLDSIGCTLLVSDRGFSSFFGVAMRKGGVNIELVDAYYIMLGVPVPTPTPPPSSPPVGFGAMCDFDTVITDTQGVTATVPVSVSTSLLVGGGFENFSSDLNYWTLYGGAPDLLPLYIVSGQRPAYEGSLYLNAYHDYNDLTDNYICQTVYVPPFTDVLGFGGAFRVSAHPDTPISGEVGFGINRGIYQAFHFTADSVDGDSWTFINDAYLNAGGQSELEVCVNYFGSGDDLAVVNLDSLFVYAFDRPDGVPDTDFSDLSVLCPDPDLVLDVAIVPTGTAPSGTATPTPDIWGGVTPIPTVGVVGGIPPIDIPVGVTPHPTTCPVYWDEVERTSPISLTIPEFGLCFVPAEIDLSGVDNAVPLPFSFTNTIILLLNAALAFLIVGLVKNR